MNSVSDVTLGLASLRLGRHRQALGQHLAAALNSDHPLRALLLLASLLHDIGKPATRTVEPSGRIRFFDHDQVGARLAQERLTELRFSAEEAARVSAIVAHHLRPLNLAGEPSVTRRAIYRYFHQTGEAGIDGAAGAGRFPGHLRRQSAAGGRLELIARRRLAIAAGLFRRRPRTIRPPVLLTGDD